MNRTTAILLALLAGTAPCVAAPAPLPSGTIADTRELIWAKEKGIYEGRSQGNLMPYVGNAAPEYLGWPPYSPEPYGIKGVETNEKSWAGQSQEKLTMALKGFTLHGDTALIYYLNHRTALPSGKAVDQNWEIIHVWVRYRDQWRLLGGMQRLGDLVRPVG